MTSVALHVRGLLVLFATECGHNSEEDGAFGTLFEADQGCVCDGNCDMDLVRANLLES